MRAPVWERIGNRLEASWDPTSWASDINGQPTTDLDQPLLTVSILAAIYVESDDLFHAHELVVQFEDALSEFGLTPYLVDSEESELDEEILADLCTYLAEAETVP